MNKGMLTILYVVLIILLLHQKHTSAKRTKRKATDRTMDVEEKEDKREWSHDDHMRDIREDMEEVKRQSKEAKGPWRQPNNEVCPSNTFECGSKECIALIYHCDGHNDCSDNSDEIGCEKVNNEHGRQGHKPGYKSEKVIDEHDQGYKSYESDPENFVCPRNLFTCKNKECTVPNARCDGIRHCTDGSDEMNCPRGTKLRTPPPTKGKDFKCPENMFTCDNKECLLPLHRCDGTKDCADGSDEMNCQSTPQDKPKNTANKKGDKMGSDPKQERDTPNGCGHKGLFQCGSKECILPKYRCDGEKDCFDGTDEVDCHTKEQVKMKGQRSQAKGQGQKGSQDRKKKTARGCGENLFECESKECILPKYVCDGDKDCSDGSDEKKCGEETSQDKKTAKGKKSGKKKPKSSTKKKQESKKAKQEKTKEEKDPEKQSEKLPDNFRCPNSLFTCSNKECVSPSVRCDMKKDCTDGSDEWGCLTFYKGAENPTPAGEKTTDSNVQGNDSGTVNDEEAPSDVKTTKVEL